MGLGFGVGWVSSVGLGFGLRIQGFGLQGGAPPDYVRQLTRGEPVPAFDLHLFLAHVVAFFDAKLNTEPP